MTMIPNFLKIRQTAQSCLDEVLTSSEASTAILQYLQPDQFIPKEELSSLTDEMKSERRLTIRLKRIEQKLNAICAYLPANSNNLPDPDSLSEEARDLAVAGQKIKAIQIHREKTGCGVAEAKKNIERFLESIQ